MKVIDLFSGIGGFSLGLESTGGFETVQFVENNKWCQKVLAKNFSNVPITGDIRNYEGQEQADVVVGGFHANLSPLQVKEKAQKMIATSGQKCYESSKHRNQDGLLAKMSGILLQSRKAWYSNKCVLTWKTKVTKSNRLLFQLQQSTLHTKDIESGLWPTPTVNCVEGGEQSSRVEKTKTGSYILRKKNKPENTFGAKLSDAILYEEKQKMWPTPTTQEIEHPNMKLNEKGRRLTKDGKDSHSLNLADSVNIKTKIGGALNPEWVEWLMGYPIEWTELKD